MTHVAKVPLPRAPEGNVTWGALVPWMDALMREIVARFDPRNPNSDFAAGVLANNDGSVTVGTQAFPAGRVASVPTLAQHLGDTGRAKDQRFGWPVFHANRNSVQNLDTVLVATSSETASQIEIQAHSVKFDFGSVAYNGGTISGLTPETLYYVYADDANFAGGAVTYYSTTNPDNLIAQGRYYLGYITTPVLATSFSVSAASATNPIEITTASAHGWTSGDTVDFATMPGDFGTALNAGSFVITVTAVNKFTVAVNGIGFAAYTSGGVVTRISTQTESGGGAGAGVGGGRFDLVNLP